MPNILVLDPAASTGYCIVSIDKSTDENSEIKRVMNINHYGYLDVNTESLYSGDWCLDFHSKIKELIEKYDIHDIAFEDYFFSSRYRTGSNMNVEYRTVIKILARQLKLNYDVVNISQWKTYIAGRSTPTKEQRKEWGKTHSKKLFIQQALWEEYGIRFPNHSISKKNGKPITFRMDIVDVIGICIFHCRSKYKIEKEDVIMNVVCEEDVKFKKEPKYCFRYIKI